MKNALISIKPKYVKNILEGNKKFEYRKKTFKQEVQEVYIYSTSPQKKIVAKFKYTGFYKATPEEIWELTKKKSGINKKEFFEYFKSSDEAYAIKINELVVFSTEYDPYEVEVFSPPQSYYYLEEELNEKLCSLA